MDQTVAIVTLDTTAANKATGEKTLPINSDVEIEDKISYCLRPGQEYTIKGTLMDKKTGDALLVNSKAVESEITLKLEDDDEPCGEIEMVFKLNTTDLDGSEIVVFESVYLDEKLVISHRDIEDDSQTVTVDLPPTPETGHIVTKNETSSEVSDTAIIIAIVSIAAIGGYVGFRIISRNKFLK